MSQRNDRVLSGVAGLLLLISGCEKRDAARPGSPTSSELARSVAVVDPELGNADPLVRAKRIEHLLGSEKPTRITPGWNPEIARENRSFAPQVVPLLKDPDSKVRENAVSALRKWEAKEFATELRPLVKDAEPAIQRASIRALGDFGCREAAGDLAALLADGDSGLRLTVLAALRQLKGEGFGKAIETCLRDPSAAVRGEAARELGWEGAREMIPSLGSYLSDNERGVRAACAEALGRLKAKERAPDIIEELMCKRHEAETALPALRAMDYQLSAKDIFKIAADAVVRLRVEHGQSTSLGSGFLVDPSGLILTNFHVLKDLSPRIRVEFRDGATSTAQLMRSYADKDLALLRLDAPRPNLPYLEFRDAPVEVGEELVVIGHPLKYGWSLTEGKASQVHEDPQGIRSTIQTDAAINPGNSGGPALDREGRVAGVVVSKVVGQGTEGIGFLIHYTIAAKFVRGNR